MAGKQSKWSLLRILKRLTGQELRELDRDHKRKIDEFAVSMSMREHGWRWWPASATDQEKKAAIEFYLNGGEPYWYPPGSELISDGKLVEKEGRKEYHAQSVTRGRVGRS